METIKEFLNSPIGVPLLILFMWVLLMIPSTALKIHRWLHKVDEESDKHTICTICVKQLSDSCPEPWPEMEMIAENIKQFTLLLQGKGRNRDREESKMEETG